MYIYRPCSYAKMKLNLNFSEGRVDFQASNGIIHNIDDVLFPFKGSFDETDDEEVKTKK